MKNYSIILIAFLLFASCSKENMNAKKLEGVWKMNSLKYNNVELVTAGSAMEIIFTEVVKNTGRYSSRLYLFNQLSKVENGDFTVSNEGTKISLKDDLVTSVVTGDIVELSSKTLQISYTDVDGNLVVFKADKN